jgi:hypothetical protein
VLWCQLSKEDALCLVCGERAKTCTRERLCFTCYVCVLLLVPQIAAVSTERVWYTERKMHYQHGKELAIFERAAWWYLWNVLTSPVGSVEKFKFPGRR